MTKSSTLKHSDVIKRLSEIQNKLDSMYYYFNENGLDDWITYCEIYPLIERLNESVQRRWLND